MKLNLVLENDWSNNKQFDKPQLYDTFTKFNINLTYGKNFYSVPKNYLFFNRPIIVGININDQIYNLKFGQVLNCFCCKKFIWYKILCSRIFFNIV